MKAVVIHEFGGLEKLRYEDRPKPEPGANEIVVKVRACALNHVDIWVREGKRGRPPMPHILGCDVSGEVSEVGKSVTSLRPGDAVVLAPGLSCQKCQSCLAGRDNLCESFNILGLQVDGGYAEFVKVPEVNALPIPAGLDFASAASIPIVFLTAWHSLAVAGSLSKAIVGYPSREFALSASELKLGENNKVLNG